jgi:hypothetical protein
LEGIYHPQDLHVPLAWFKYGGEKIEEKCFAASP